MVLRVDLLVVGLVYLVVVNGFDVARVECFVVDGDVPKQGNQTSFLVLGFRSDCNKVLSSLCTLSLLKIKYWPA